MPVQQHPQAIPMLRTCWTLVIAKVYTHTHTHINMYTVNSVNGWCTSQRLVDRPLWHKYYNFKIDHYAHLVLKVDPTMNLMASIREAWTILLSLPLQSMVHAQDSWFGIWTPLKGWLVSSVPSTVNRGWNKKRRTCGRMVVHNHFCITSLCTAVDLLWPWKSSKLVRYMYSVQR